MRKWKTAPGLVLGVLALVLAMTGSAVGARLITGGQVKNSSLTGKDIKNKSLTAKDFRGSLRGPAGAPGDPGPAGAPGEPGMDGVDGVGGDGQGGGEDLVLRGVADSITIPAGEALGGMMPCPSGTQVVSGGYDLDAVDGEVFVDAPEPDATGWTVIADNTDGTQEARLVVIAWCSGSRTDGAKKPQLQQTARTKRLAAQRMARGR